jgi:hypothetical protein
MLELQRAYHQENEVSFEKVHIIIVEGNNVFKVNVFFNLILMIIRLNKKKSVN